MYNLNLVKYLIANNYKIINYTLNFRLTHIIEMLVLFNGKIINDKILDLVGKCIVYDQANSKHNTKLGDKIHSYSNLHISYF